MLGLSISELLASPAIEIDEWARFYSENMPWQEAIPKLMAEQCAMFYNAHTNPEKNKALSAADFLPALRAKPKPPPDYDTPDEDIDISDILGVEGN